MTWREESAPLLRPAEAHPVPWPEDDPRSSRDSGDSAFGTFAVDRQSSLGSAADVSCRPRFALPPPLVTPTRRSPKASATSPNAAARKTATKRAHTNLDTLAAALDHRASNRPAKRTTTETLMRGLDNDVHRVSIHGPDCPAVDAVEDIRGPPPSVSRGATTIPAPSSPEKKPTPLCGDAAPLLKTAKLPRSSDDAALLMKTTKTPLGVAADAAPLQKTAKTPRSNVDALLAALEHPANHPDHRRSGRVLP